MKEAQLQTPQKDQISVNRRLKPTPDPKRNLRKVVKKSLNPDFTVALKEDDPDLQSSEEVPLISGDNPCIEFIESINSLTCSPDTPASETVAVSECISPSSALTLDENVGFDTSNNKYEVSELDSFKMLESIEADMVVSSLKEARIKVLKSKGLDHSKNLLEALINVAIEEFCDAKTEEKTWIDKLLSSKVHLAFLTFIMLSFAFVVWFLNLSSNDRPSGLPPT